MLETDDSPETIFSSERVIGGKVYAALSRAVANGGAGGGNRLPTSPPRGTLAPPRTFTGLITEGQLEHYGINTEEKINGKYKRKVQETSEILINSLIFTLKTSKFFHHFYFLSYNYL